ncbi:MAG: hypothetical protein OEW36_06095 [Hylemonella sp.]|nr:hypothetical protein [Hylemonella sp.]
MAGWAQETPIPRSRLSRLVSPLVCLGLACAPLYPAHAANQASAQAVQPGAADLTAFQAAHPQARVIRVSAEDYPALQGRLRAAGYQPQADASPQLLAANAHAPLGPESAQSAPARSDCDESGLSGDGGESRVGVHINMNVGSGHSHGGRGGSGDSAAVLFVIVGAVVLVVWTLYAVKYVIDRARGIDGCHWSEWALTTSGIQSYRPQYANFSGLRYLSGSRSGHTHFGISAELGHADVQLTEVGILRLRGLYWLVGPLLRWSLSTGRNPSYFQMEFLVGSTEHQEMGTIAAARMGVNFGLSDRLRLGVSYGALNLNLHEQGIILDRSQYYGLWGLDLGYRF